MSLDPRVTNREHYKIVFWNKRVRVLEYRDQPGESRTPHSTRQRHVRAHVISQTTCLGHRSARDSAAGRIGRWLPAQQHHGENIGDTPTHVIFV
jgi:hypothetical protein